jgi:hypothetical protein
VVAGDFLPCRYGGLFAVFVASLSFVGNNAFVDSLGDIVAFAREQKYNKIKKLFHGETFLSK